MTSAPKWNRAAAVLQECAPLPEQLHAPLGARAALLAVARSAAACVAAAYCARLSPLLARHHLLSRRSQLLLCWLLCGLSAAAAIRGAQALYAWQRSRGIRAQQEKLAAAQRKLMGLPPVLPKAPPPAQRKPQVPAAAAAQAAFTPLSPPQRYSRTPPGPSLGAAGVAGDFQTPPSGASIRKPSPHSVYSAGAVATPEQIRMYMESFTPERAAAAAAAPSPSPLGAAPSPLSAAAGGGGGVGVFGAAAGAGGVGSPHAMPGFGMFHEEEQPDMALAAAMPVGVEVPRYRPSWLPRAKAAGHQVAPDLLTASTEEEVDDFLWGVLRARRSWMEVWTERLREWFASKVLQPLLEAVQCAHADVNKVLLKYGQPARLPALDALVGGSSSSSSGNDGSYGGSGNGGTGADKQEDVEALIRHAQQYCNALGSAPGGGPQAADAQALMAALVRYEQLLLLLRGRYPGNLLPPSPAGYIWRRVQMLAEGSCMPAYTWNAGGPWAGRAWSPDLPNDSLLALYLFSAFLSAPGWHFADSLDALARTGGGAGGVGGAGAGRGLPLFLGALKPRPPPQYSAVLAYRPEKLGRGVDAILALHPAAGGGEAGVIAAPGGGTMCCFVAEGRLLALTGYNAMFHAILAFLLYHNSKYNGAVGLHYLQDEALSLSKVLEIPAPGLVAQPQTVFGWWFPPNRSKAD